MTSSPPGPPAPRLTRTTACLPAAPGGPPFVHFGPEVLAAALGAVPAAAVEEFTGSWDDLPADTHLGTDTPYRFRRPDGDPTDYVPNGGRGAPTQPNGMVHGAFRPSDDACTLPLNVPVNLSLAAALEQVAPVAAAVGAADSAIEARSIAAEIRAGVARDGNGATADVWAYEIDGLGGRVSVVELDPVRALTAHMDGYRVALVRVEHLRPPDIEDADQPLLDT